MHPGLLDVLAAHPDCYFQIFTNGQFITDKVAGRLRAIGNATPPDSIEGREIASDERCGKKDVFNKTMRGLDACLRHGLLPGVATSVCQTNIDELLTEDWLRELIRRGAHYTWYHTYRPVGPKMNQTLALRPMANDVSHHISPRGDIEPCPIIQFATETIRDPRGLYTTLRGTGWPSWTP